MADAMSVISTPCFCSDCLNETWLDEDGMRQKGRLFSARQLADHRAQLRSRENAANVIQRNQSASKEEAKGQEDGGPRNRLARNGTTGDSHNMDELRQDSVYVNLQLHCDHIKSWRESLAVLQTLPVSFVIPPDAQVDVDSLPFDHRMLGLVTTDAPGRSFDEFERWLVGLRDFISAEAVARSPNVLVRATSTTLQRQVEPALESLTQVKRQKWKEAAEVNVVSLTFHTNRVLKENSVLTLACWILAMTIHLFARVSIEHSTFLLIGLRLILQLSLASSKLGRPAVQKIIQSIPRHIRSLFKEMELDASTTGYVCCPSCFKTWKHDSAASPPTYPEFCTGSHPTRDFDLKDPRKPALCNRRLRSAQLPFIPKRLFFCQDLKAWLARLYARRDIERMLDAHALRMAKETGIPVVMEDIWDGDELRRFLSSFPGKSVGAGGTESHLVFGINEDGMNPYGNKMAGKKVSVGPIYLVCLNLPPHIRYRSENIFLVGIVPGPFGPSLEQINYLLQPMVDDVDLSWNQGFYLAQTANHMTGRRVRCAILPIIADLPAARQLSGFGSHANTEWCSECHETIHNRDNLDFLSWKTRNKATHLRHAQAWRDAATPSEKKAHFNVHHVRWSELLRLPYWDPTKHVTFDAMHGFYLRIFHRHIRDIWGMDIRFEDGVDVVTSQDSNLPASVEEMDQVILGLQAGISEGFKRHVLIQLCKAKKLRYGGTPKELVRRLKDHARRFLQVPLRHG